MQVENLNDKVTGVFLVKSIDEVGHEEVFFQDLDIQTQLFTVQLDFDKEKKYTHEVSVIAPRCTVNGERQSYTSILKFRVSLLQKLYSKFSATDLTNIVNPLILSKQGTFEMVNNREYSS